MDKTTPADDAPDGAVAKARAQAGQPFTRGRPDLPRQATYGPAPAAHARAQLGRRLRPAPISRPARGQSRHRPSTISKSSAARRPMMSCSSTWATRCARAAPEWPSAREATPAPHFAQPARPRAPRARSRPSPSPTRPALRRPQPQLKRVWGVATSMASGVSILTPLVGGVGGFGIALAYGGSGLAVWCAPCASSLRRRSAVHPHEPPPPASA